MGNTYISFKYQFASDTIFYDVDRYIQDIKMEIFIQNINDDSIKLIGQANFKIVLIEQAINDSYDLFEVFDVYEYTLRHAQKIFDFENEELNQNILEFYQHTIHQPNICFLERIEILPVYRGYKIAAKATSDIVFQHTSSCGLFVIQPYPLQLEPDGYGDSEWRQKMKLEKLMTDENAASQKLKNYYKSMGFDEIKGYRDLLFLNPNMENDKLNAINLDD